MVQHPLPSRLRRRGHDQPVDVDGKPVDADGEEEAEDDEQKVVSDILGHTQIAITADLYGHVYDAARDEAAGRMDDLFGRLDAPPSDDNVDRNVDEEGK